MTRRSAQIALLVCSVVVSVALLEGILRTTGLFFPPGRAYVGEYQNRPSRNFVVDSATGWRMVPRHQFSWRFDGTESAYRSNSQGFRSDRDFVPAEARRKIVLVGDSFTFGTGVDYEQTYGAVIEANLSGTVVYNLAMPGFGIDQMWMSVRNQALALKPDMIIVAFIDDDFDRSLTAYRDTEGFNKPTFLLRDGRLHPESSEDRPSLFVRMLDNHSTLWTATHSAVRNLSRRVAFGQWLVLNEALLAALQRDCLENGVPLLFVRLLRKNDGRRFATLRSFMRRISASYLDARDDGLPPPGLYFAHDDHMNAMGHRVVAERILPWIRENLPTSLGSQHSR